MDVKLTASSINDGSLLSDIDDAIEKAIVSMDLYPDLKASRTITVQIKITPDKTNERIVHTEASVMSKLPVPGRSGIAWKKDGTLETSTENRDPRQVDLEHDKDELSALREVSERTQKIKNI